MSKIFKECCKCHIPTYSNAKYCSSCRRRISGRTKQEWEAINRPHMTPGFVVSLATMTVVDDPDTEAGYPKGAQLLGHEIKRQLESGYLTPGMILDCKGRRLVVEGKPLAAQRLVIA